MKIIKQALLALSAAGMFLIFPSCGSDSESTDENVSVEVNFLINGKNLKKEATDFIKDEVDVFNEPDKVLIVQVGQEVVFKDVSTPKPAAENREWDVFSDKEPDGSEPILTKTFTIDEAGLNEVELIVNDRVKVRKLIYVVEDAADVPEYSEVEMPEGQDTESVTTTPEPAPSPSNSSSSDRIAASDSRTTTKSPPTTSSGRNRIDETTRTTTRTEPAAPARPSSSTTADSRNTIASNSNTSASGNNRTSTGSLGRNTNTNANTNNTAPPSGSNSINSKTTTVPTPPPPAKEPVAKVTPPPPAPVTKPAEKKPAAPVKPTVSSISLNAKSSVQTGRIISFDGSVTPPEAIENITWDFGDGKIKSAGRKVKESHVYKTAGNYRVKMCVNGTSNCKTVNVSVTAPPPPPPPPVTAGADADFFCGGSSKISGVKYGDRCDGAAYTTQAVMSLAPTRKMQLTKTTLYSSNSGKAQFKLTYNDGGDIRNETVTGALNKGKTEVYLEDLNVVLNPGINYTLTVSVKDGSAELQNIADCGVASQGNSELGINYKGKQVLFDLKYCY